jgi:hypothetical protein
MDRTAVVFLAHSWTDTHRRRFERLSRETAGVADCYVLYQTAEQANAGHERGPLEAVPRGRIHTFGARDLPLRLGYPYLTRRGVIPGCPHYALIDFARTHRYARYISVEHDVEFTGDWSVLVGACSSVATGLVAAHLRWYRDAPHWGWWRSLRPPPNETVSVAELVRAFLPVYCISHEALMAVDTLQRMQWRGHFEALLPTLVSRSGFGILDLNLLHPFCAGTEQEPQPAGSTKVLSTLRWRPPVSVQEFEERFRPNLIFHPIKEDWHYDGVRVIGVHDGRTEPQAVHDAE